MLVVLFIHAIPTIVKAQQQNSSEKYTSKKESFTEIIDYNRNFNEINNEIEAYFKEKHPNLSPKDLVSGEHRDGKYVKYQRWKNYWEYLVDKDGQFPNVTAKYNEIKQLKNVRYQLKSSQQATNPLAAEPWENISHVNPINGGIGRTTYIAFHPTNKNIFYVAAAQGGIWRTENHGLTYTSLGDDLPMLSISGIVVNHQNPSEIYIAISDHVDYGPAGIGIYKSTDEGQNWTPTNLTFDIRSTTYIYDMAVAPNDPLKIFAATSLGLYMTLDGFQTYHKVFFGNTYKIKYSYISNDIIYLATRSGELYKSTNGGINWTMTYDAGNSFPFMALTPANPQKVVLSVKDSIHISTDAGESFVTKSHPSSTRSSAVAISPQDENKITVGFVNLKRSYDDGQSWETQQVPHVDQRNVFLNPLEDNVMYWCHDGGVSRLNVFNNSWDDISSGLQITQYYDIAHAATNVNIVAGGSQDNGNIYRNAADEWGLYTIGGDGMVQGINPIDDNIRYWSFQNGALKRTEFSPDGSQIITTITPDPGGQWVTPYRLDETNPDRLIAGYGYVYETLDRGDTWDTISPLLENGQDLNHVAISKSNPNKIYACRNNFYAKNTNDNNWTTYAAPPGGTITDIEVDHLDENIVYVSVSGYNAGNKVFKSTDGGASWTNITKGLENVAVFCLETYDDRPGGLFIGTDFGVYYTEESLPAWYEYGELPHVQVRDIEIQYNAQLIRIGTHGRGIYESNINLDLCNPQDADSDNDEICDLWDVCPQIDDTLVGQTCDDANDCTQDDIYNAHCDCQGNLIDINYNGICDNDELWQYTPEYCSAGGSNGTTNDFIDYVAFNTIVNTSGKTSYSDFTLFNTTVARGSTYNITIEAKQFYGGTRAFAWIDWNRDFIFDETELVVSAVSSNGSTQTVIIPQDAVLDSVLLRVKTQGGGSNTGYPCSSNQSGEVEDYLVIIEDCNDIDNDGICSINDQCPELNNSLFGLACDDNDPCTGGETYNANCDCSGGTLVIDINSNNICDLDELWQHVPDYCNAAGASGTGGDWLKRVNLNTLDNTSGKTPYSDFSFLQTTLLQDSTYTLTLEANATYGGTSAYAWIDWNRDFVLNSSEQITMSGFNAKISTGTFTVPSDVVLDSILLRTRIQGGNSTANPCTAGYSGEVEDYLLIIEACNDTDNDGLCAVYDTCPTFDNNLIGTACDDNDPCTGGETYDADCGCSGGTLVIDINSNNICDLDELWQHVPDYCNAAGANGTGGDWLKRVSLNTLDNTSGKTPYSDFSFLQTTLLQDSTYTLTLEANATYGGTSAYAWIDWNRDFVLNSSEQITMSGFNAKISTGTFTVPSDVVLDSILLRTRIQGGNSTANPCTAGYSGEVEDYLLIIEACNDTDNDGLCAVYDTCPTFDNNLIGTACDDNDPCTGGETYDADCGCSGGTLVLDINGNNICDNDEVWQYSDMYCFGGGSNGTGGDWMKNVSINTIDNTSGKTSYSDYTFLSTRLYTDSTYTLTLKANVTYGGTNAYAWIDWNRDFVLNSSEQITMSGFNARVSTGTFTVPTDAVLDSILLRTKIQGGNSTAAPCNHLQSGEVEDYLLIIDDCTDVNNNNICDADDCVDIQLNAYLQGVYDATSGEMTTRLNSRGLLPGQTPVSNLAVSTPAGQPYSAAPWNYTGTEGIGWTDADYTGDETDWVLVSFRTGTTKSTEVGMTAGLLMKDGSIDFPNRCALPSTVASPLYIVVEHRNHIGIMTLQPVDVINSALTYDFRLSDSYRDATSFGQKQLPTGEWVMFAGDGDQSDLPSFDILGSDKTLWFDNNGIFDYYLSPDFNLDGDVNGQDKSLWFENNGISSRVPK